MITTHSNRSEIPEGDQCKEGEAVGCASVGRDDERTVRRLSSLLPLPLSVAWCPAEDVSVHMNRCSLPLIIPLLAHLPAQVKLACYTWRSSLLRMYFIDYSLNTAPSKLPSKGLSVSAIRGATMTSSSQTSYVVCLKQ